MSKARVKPVAVKAAGTVAALAETPNATAPAVPDTDTTTYIVGDCPMLHDGEVYAPGDEIELTPKQALRSARRVSLPVAAFPQLNLE